MDTAFTPEVRYSPRIHTSPKLCKLSDHTYTYIIITIASHIYLDACMCVYKSLKNEIPMHLKIEKGVQIYSMYVVQGTGCGVSDKQTRHGCYWGRAFTISLPAVLPPCGILIQKKGVAPSSNEIPGVDQRKWVELLGLQLVP